MQQPYLGKNIAILTAGGDTTALNNTIVAARYSAQKLGAKVYGIMDGYYGIIHEPDSALRDLNSVHIDGKVGGTILGSRRTPKQNGNPCNTVANYLRDKGVDALIVIGGDGSSAIAQAIYERHEFPVLVIPKTVDNDLKTDTLHRSSDKRIIAGLSPGYVTAADKVSTMVAELQTSASSHKQLYIVETMGRDSGYMAAAASHGGADMILLPEMGRPTIDELVSKVDGAYRKVLSENGNHFMIAVAEGFSVQGHVASQTKIGSYVAAIISDELKRLGHNVDVKDEYIGRWTRSGSPHKYDFKLAELLGHHLEHVLRDAADSEGNLNINRFGKMAVLQEIVGYDHLEADKIRTILIKDALAKNGSYGRIPSEYINPERYTGTEHLDNFLERLLETKKLRHKAPELPIVASAR